MEIRSENYQASLRHSSLAVEGLSWLRLPKRYERNFPHRQ